jgi:hypothetical protein
LTLSVKGLNYPAKLTASSISFWHPQGKRRGGQYTYSYVAGRCEYWLADLELRCSGKRHLLTNLLSVEDLGVMTSPEIRRAVDMAQKRIKTARDARLGLGQLAADAKLAEHNLLGAALRGSYLGEVGELYRLAHERLAAAKEQK